MEDKTSPEEIISTESNPTEETTQDNNTTEMSTEEKLQKELDELKDKYIRMLAEFDNFKRRSYKERVDLQQTAGKDIIISLLDVLDDCDRAENQIKQQPEKLGSSEGTLLVFNKLRNVLQQKGLTAFESVQQDFDVEKHEAITTIEAGEDNSGKVVDELQKGYYLNEKLIRFAKVVVGK
jgi:molecular chaperone GrpE